MLKKSLIAKTDGKADKSQIFIGYGVRRFSESISKKKTMLFLSLSAMN